jgi:FkbM family methyltransferase
MLTPGLYILNFYGRSSLSSMGRVGKMKDLFMVCLKTFRARLLKRNYRDFILYYSRGTSLVECLKHAEVYEKNLSEAIINVLKREKAPIFLDIGANIGLITLNVLCEVTNATVHAFEPGPHQHLLLFKTIKINDLSAKVVLHNQALSNQTGKSRFAIHNTSDASGDGFFDTGRAGPARNILVDCIKLDDWWISNEKPNITALKIDTEGSELMVMQGGSDMISECLPSLFIEIWPENLRCYPYDAEDILNWLNQNRYALYTLFEAPVTLSNCKSYFGSCESFVARPLYLTK